MKKLLNLFCWGGARPLAVWLAVVFSFSLPGCTWRTEGTYEADGELPIPSLGEAEASLGERPEAAGMAGYDEAAVIGTANRD